MKPPRAPFDGPEYEGQISACRNWEAIRVPEYGFLVWHVKQLFYNVDISYIASKTGASRELTFPLHIQAADSFEPLRNRWMHLGKPKSPLS